MATHSSVLAWRIPGTGSLVGCCLWGRTESDTTEVISSSSSVASPHFLRLRDPHHPDFARGKVGYRDRRR